jgi:AraC-like DNA-binding protein
MKDLNLRILTGGFYNCTPAWNKTSSGSDSCFKIYHPISGSACMYIDGNRYELTSGRIYFINGFLLDRHECDHQMDVYWLHFIPGSMIFRNYLEKLEPFYVFDEQCCNFDDIPYLFDNSGNEENKLKEEPPVEVLCMITSRILKLLSLMMEKQKDSMILSAEAYRRFRPALDFIDENYRKNISITAVANQCFLGKEHFIREFKKVFRMTPYNHIVQKRMDEAAVLLRETGMTINDISSRLGYCSQFYFSRAFKNYFDITPTGFRNEASRP